MEELKNCPFCGKNPKFGELDGHKGNYLIWCECLMAQSETGVNGNTKEEIIKAWNTRAEKE